MRTFIAVAETGSFTKAAERLDMSRALVSKYVMQLEERLGLQLLNRTTRSVSPTDNGRAYLDPCRRLLEDFDELEARMLDQNEALRGRIRMTAPLAFGELYLPRVIGEFTALHPQVRIETTLSDRFVNLVEEGYDLAVRGTELDDSSLIARRLATARLLVCASPDYLSRHGAPQHPQELAAHTCIIDSNYRGGARWLFRVDGKLLRVDVDGPVSINSAMASRALALAGRGISLCPSFVVRDDIEAGRLVRLLQPCEYDKFGLHALYPQSRHLAPRIRLFIDFLAASFKGRLRLPEEPD